MSSGILKKIFEAGDCMGIYYYKLFDLIARRNIKKGELCQLANISKVTMSKLVKNQVIQTDTVNKICTALECQPGDIMEWIGDGKSDYEHQ